MVTRQPEISRICSSFGMAVISLLFSSTTHLAQADVIGCGPGADHVNGRLAAGRVEAAAERLAVDGHDYLPVGHFVQGRDPTQQAPLEFGRLDRAEDGVETIVRRDAGAEIEELSQPLPLLASVLRNRYEVIGTGNHGANGDADDIDQRIHDLPPPRISQRRKLILDADGAILGHGAHPWPAATRPPTDAQCFQRIAMSHL